MGGTFRMKIISYDIEVFPNLILINFFDPHEKFKHETFTFFEHEKGSEMEAVMITAFESYLQYIQDAILVSFNGVSYDQNVIAAFRDSDYNVAAAYQRSVDIVVNKKYHYNTGLPCKQEIDILKILPRGAGSLKKIQGKLGAAIVEFKGGFDAYVTEKDLGEIILYCQNDCEFTMRLYDHPFVQDRMRIKNFLVERFDLWEFNRSESQIGCDIIINHVRKELGLRSRKQFSEYVFPRLKGEASELLNLKPVENYKWYNLALAEAAEYITKFEFNYTKTFNPQTRQYEYKNENPLEHDAYFTGNNEPIKGAPHLTIGEGGIHLHNVSGIWKGNLINLDVKSMYPTIMHNLKITPYSSPEFAIKFVDIFSYLLKMRMEAIERGDKITASALKIPLNAITGEFKNSFSSICDPSAHLQIVLNAQLSMLVLVDGLLQLGVNILHVNTDGVVIELPPSHNPAASQLTEFIVNWEDKFRMKLESENFSTAIILDTNNYCFLNDKNNVVKASGRAFETEMSLLRGGAEPFIVGLALIEYAINKTEPIKTIQKYIEAGNIDPFVFIKSVKTPEEVRGVYRYWLSNKGEERIAASLASYGSKCTYCNDVTLGSINAMSADINIKIYEELIKDRIASLHNQDRANEILKLKDRGLAIIPVKEGTKEPAVRWLEFTTKAPLKTITRKWFKNDFGGTQINVAAICGKPSKIIVLDIDDLEMVKFNYNEIPKGCAIVKTPRGLHIYFKYSKEKSQRLSPNVELKSDSCIVLIPPSVNSNGVSYQWIQPLLSVKDLPEYKPEEITIVDRGVQKTQCGGVGGVKKAHTTEQPTEVKEGARNSTLASFFGKAIRRNCGDFIKSKAETFELNLKFTNPLPEYEVDGICNSIHKSYRLK